MVDSLLARGIATAVLLRPHQRPAFYRAPVPHLDVRIGSISQPSSLGPALRDITHVIHCAGCTEARARRGVSEIGDHAALRHLVAAINRHRGLIQRLVHISSLAAGGPALPGDPPAKRMRRTQSRDMAGASLRASRRRFAARRIASCFGRRLSWARGMRDFYPCSGPPGHTSAPTWAARG